MKSPWGKTASSANHTERNGSGGEERKGNGRTHRSLLPSRCHDRSQAAKRRARPRPLPRSHLQCTKSCPPTHRQALHSQQQGKTCWRIVASGCRTVNGGQLSPFLITYQAAAEFNSGCYVNRGTIALVQRTSAWLGPPQDNRLPHDRLCPSLGSTPFPSIG